MRPEEGSEELPGWKSPYTRAILWIDDLYMADKIIWYAYRFPQYFLKHMNYAEDILHEILLEVGKIPPVERNPFIVSRVARNTVARFIAKVCMTLSGYTNFRSWLHRRTFLSVRDGVDKKDVKTELELAVEEIQRIWNEPRENNKVAMMVADRYPNVSKYADSGLSMVNFCKLHKITKYRLCKQIDEARDYYIHLTKLIEYIK